MSIKTLGQFSDNEATFFFLDKFCQNFIVIGPILFGKIDAIIRKVWLIPILSRLFQNLDFECLKLLFRIDILTW